MIRACVVLGLAALCSTAPARAGVFGDDLSRCLVDSTTKEDRAALVRWIFIAMSQHPMVSSMSNVKAEQKEQANKEIGALFMRLLTEACQEKTRAAVKAEGAATIQLSFQVLGQVAAGELFSDPSVIAVMSGLDKYLDADKLKELGGVAGAR
jgi:hypothetical protein